MVLDARFNCKIQLHLRSQRRCHHFHLNADQNADPKDSFRGSVVLTNLEFVTELSSAKVWLHHFVQEWEIHVSNCGVVSPAKSSPFESALVGHAPNDVQCCVRRGSVRHETCLTRLHLQRVCRETDHGHRISHNIRRLQRFQTPQNTEVRFNLELSIELHLVLPFNLSSLPINVVSCGSRASSPTVDTASSSLKIRQLGALRYHVRILSSQTTL